MRGKKINNTSKAFSFSNMSKKSKLLIATFLCAVVAFVVVFYMLPKYSMAGVQDKLLTQGTQTAQLTDNEKTQATKDTAAETEDTAATETQTEATSESQEEVESYGTASQTNTTAETPAAQPNSADGALNNQANDTYSTNLADFATSIYLNEVKYTDGKSINNITLNTTYTEFAVEFAETQGGLQFENETDTKPLTYTLPSGTKSPSTQTGTIMMDCTEFKIYDNQYSINDNVITFRWNTTDSNFDKLKNLTNATFQIKFDIQFTSYEQIQFGNETSSCQVEIVQPTADLSLSVSASYDKYTNTVGHKLTSYAIRDHTNVDIIITNVDALLYDSSTIKVYIDGTEKTKDTDYTLTEPTETPKLNFEIKFKEGVTVSSGQEIKVAFTSNVDIDKVTKYDDGKRTDYKINSNQMSTYKSDWTYVYPNYSSINVEASLASQPDDYTSYNWIVTCNESTGTNLKGQDIITKISAEDSTELTANTTIDGEIKVVVTNKDGTTIRDTEKITAPTSMPMELKYTVPADEAGAYKYVITFKTKSKNSSLLTTKQLTTDATMKIFSASKSVDISPGTGKGIDVLKEHGEVTYNSIEWKITLTIPETGLTQAIVTDELPYYYGTYYDKYQEGSISITGLNDPETYSLDVTGTDRQKMTITFYQDAAKQTPGLAPTTTSRNIVITFVTTFDEDTPSYQHNNTAVFSAKDDKGEEYTDNDPDDDPPTPPIKPSTDFNIEKSSDGKFVQDSEGTQYIQYKISLSGVNTEADIDIEDRFNTATEDTEVFDYYSKYSSYGDELGKVYALSEYGYKGRYAKFSWEYIKQTVGEKELIKGIKIHLDKDSIPWYNQYIRTDTFEVIYALKVANQTQFEDLLVAGKGSFAFKNVATMNSKSAECTITATGGKTDLFDKVIIQQPTSDDRNAKFKVTINDDTKPRKMNDGESLEIVDTYDASTLLIDPTSIEFKTIYDGQEVPLLIGTKYQIESGKITFTVPDEYIVYIYYTGKVLGNGTITISNTISWEDYSSSTEDTATYTAQGAASETKINFLVYDKDNSSTTLPDAEFTLCSDQEGKKEIETKDLKSISDGTMSLGQNDGYQEFQFNKYYYLKETKQPIHYLLPSDTFKFCVSDSGEYDPANNIYPAGYYVPIPNEKVKHNLTIHYKEEGTETTLHEDYNDKFYETEVYDVASPEIAGYTAKRTQVYGTMGNQDIDETVYYVAGTQTNYGIKVNYYYYGTKVKIFDSHTEKVIVGDTYSVSSPLKEGYTADKKIVEGTMPAENLEFDVYYWTGYYYWVPINKYEINEAKQKTTTFVNGAHLQVSVSSTPGTIIDNWVTEDSTHYIFVQAGTYTLTETQKPAGYKQASDISFVVDSNGKIKIGGTEVQSVDMYDELSDPASFTLVGTKAWENDKKPPEFAEHAYQVVITKDEEFSDEGADEIEGTYDIDTATWKWTSGTSTFTRIGNYKFTVKEVKKEKTGVTFDDTVYTVDLAVTEDTTNQALVANSIIKDADGEEYTKIEFNNKYEPLPIELQANSAEVTYNGKEQSVSGFEGYNKEHEGYEFDAVLDGVEQKVYVKDVTASAKGTNAYVSEPREQEPRAYETTNDLTNAKVVDASGKDVTQWFDITSKTGYLKIARKSIIGADVVLGDTLVYNGQEQQQTVKSATIDGLDIFPATREVTGDKATEPGNYTLNIEGLYNFKDNQPAPWAIIDKTFGYYEVNVIQGTHAPELALNTEKFDVLLSCATANEIARASKDKEKLIIDFTIENANNSLPADPKTAFEQKINELELTKGQYFSINLFKHFENEPAKVTRIEEVKDPGFNLSVTVPDYLREPEGDFERQYTMLKYHDGVSKTGETSKSQGYKFNFALSDYSDLALQKTSFAIAFNVPVYKYELNEQGQKTEIFIDGAKLELWKESATSAADSWTTVKNENHLITVETGKYTLKETYAPQGYRKAAPIEVVVDDDGQIYIGSEKVSSICMYDPLAYSTTSSIGGKKAWEDDVRPPVVEEGSYKVKIEQKDPETFPKTGVNDITGEYNVDKGFMTWMSETAEFTRLGTYEYKVTEINTSKTGVKYDETEFYVKFVVSQVDDKLVATRTITTKTGATPEEVKFTNKYQSQELILYANSDGPITYDGEWHEVSGYQGYEFDAVLDGVKQKVDVIEDTVSAYAKGKNAYESGPRETKPAEYPTTDDVSKAKVYDKNGNDVTIWFAIKDVPGVLTIERKSIIDADVVLDDVVEYTGEEQKQEIESVTIDDLVVDTYEVTGDTATEPGNYVMDIEGTYNFKDVHPEPWVIVRDWETVGNIIVNVNQTDHAPRLDLVSTKGAVVKACATANELARASKDDEELIFDFVIEDADNLLPDDPKEAFEDEIERLDLVKGQYFSINLFKHFKSEPEDVTRIEEVEKAKFDLCVTVPEYLRGVADGFERHFTMLMYNDEEVSKTGETNKDQDYKVNFALGDYSDEPLEKTSFALAYDDVEIPDEPAQAVHSSKTYDANGLAVFALMLVVASSAVVIIRTRKRIK